MTDARHILSKRVSRGIAMRWSILALDFWSAAFTLPIHAAETPLVAELQPVRTFEVAGDFRDDDGKRARDVSGIACTPAFPDGRRQCVLVNDEDQSVQAATLDEGRLTAGAKLKLLGDAPSANVVGARPEGLACSGGEVRFKDLDGESVGFLAPTSMSPDR